MLLAIEHSAMHGYSRADTINSVYIKCTVLFTMCGTVFCVYCACKTRSGTPLHTYPMPTAICLSASVLSPIPEAMIMAESGTAPSSGSTTPPVRARK